MKKVFILTILVATLSGQEFKCIVSSITSSVKNRMLSGGSWHKGCPVGLDELKLLRISYFDFNGKVKVGEMVVNGAISKRVCIAFKGLYDLRYPIKQMRLVSDFKAKDDASMRANNTSAFNCRLMTNSLTKWSNHSYGLAIDLNPLQNPYVAHGVVLPEIATKYKERIHKSTKAQDRAKLVRGDDAIAIFKSLGFKWGGDYKSLKDYQHFEYLGKLPKVKKSQPKLQPKAVKKPNIKKLFNSVDKDMGTSNNR